MSNKNNDGRASLRDPKQQSNEYYEPIKGMPGKFRDLDMINDDGMKVIKKIDKEIERLDSSYNGNCTRIWITYEEPKEHGKEPRWKVEVDVAENQWIETPTGNNDRVVKEGDSILAIVDEMLTDLKERMPVEDVEHV